MSRQGAPSKEKEDGEAILWMLELWLFGDRIRSVRHASRIVAGLETVSPSHRPRYSQKDDDRAECPKPSSVAKRYERRFRVLMESGEAEQVTAYIVFKRYWVTLYGRADNQKYSDLKLEAIDRAAHALSTSVEELGELARQGRETLSILVPHAHLPSLED